MDRLSNLLSRFGVRANLFYDGDLCGSASYDGAERRGYIHLLQAGSVTLLGPDRKDLQLTRPSLIFMPRPAKHQLFAGESDGAKLLCASMEFEGGIDNPLSASLPDCLVLALDDLPMLADTGGNTGSQSATVVVRALALREITPKDAIKVFLKEFQVSLMLAIVLGLLSWGKVQFLSRHVDLPAGFTLCKVGVAIALALGMQVVSATIIGALLPLGAAKMKWDPAIVASPALTTIVDITGLLIYFHTAKLLLGI